MNSYQMAPITTEKKQKKRGKSEKKRDRMLLENITSTLGRLESSH